MPALTLPSHKRSPGSSSNKKLEAPATNPAHLARQWKAVFEHGRKAGPFVNGLGAASWLYVAATLPTGEVRARNLYIIGALFAMGVVPFTFTIMHSTIMELYDRAEKAESDFESEDERDVTDNNPTTRELIRYWSMLAFARGLLPLVGMACVINANL